MHHFISYSTADGHQFALQLADALEAGPPPFRTWLDSRRLQPDSDWDAQIDQAIRRCDGLIFVMTPDSVEDASVCKDEWVRALKFKKPLALVRAHRDAELPFRLGSRQYIDFTADFDTGLAVCGLALCDCPQHVPAAIEAYCVAHRITSAAGIVQDALMLFDALAAADTANLLAPVRPAIGQAAQED